MPRTRTRFHGASIVCVQTFWELEQLEEDGTSSFCFKGLFALLLLVYVEVWLEHICAVVYGASAAFCGSVTVSLFFLFRGLAARIGNGKSLGFYSSTLLLLGSCLLFKFLFIFGPLPSLFVS
jgi:hypothetical protein